MENNLNINSQFASYEIALPMSRIGFDEECIAVYSPTYGLIPQYQVGDEFDCFKNSTITADGYFTAPLWQQVIDWFREKHKIFIEIRFADKALTEYEFTVFCTWEEYVDGITEKIMGGDERPTYTYEEARKKAILKAINQIK